VCRFSPSHPTALNPTAVVFTPTGAFKRLRSESIDEQGDESPSKKRRGGQSPAVPATPTGSASSAEDEEEGASAEEGAHAEGAGAGTSKKKLTIGSLKGYPNAQSLTRTAKSQIRYIMTTENPYPNLGDKPANHALAYAMQTKNLVLEGGFYVMRLAHKNSFGRPQIPFREIRRRCSQRYALPSSHFFSLKMQLSELAYR
jgi:hypothetical protein